MTFGDDGYYCVQNDSSDTYDFVHDWFQDEGLTNIHVFFGNPPGSYWTDMGIEGYVPYSVLFDMDGNMRLRHTGNLTANAQWERVIGQCTGSV